MSNNPTQRRSRRSGRFVVTADSAGASYRRARLRLISIQADIVEAELKALRESLIERTEAEVVWGNIKALIRERVLRIPNEVTGAIQAAKSPVEVQAILRDAIYAALSELATTEFRPMNQGSGS
jgi:hypothetical protein